MNTDQEIVNFGDFTMVNEDGATFQLPLTAIPSPSASLELLEVVPYLIIQMLSSTTESEDARVQSIC